MIQIILTNDKNQKVISGFSKNKAKHITETKQWEYVLNTIINNYSKTK